MSFRRIPFQFSSTDPVERQAELEKRFGLPSRNKMYVDVTNPLSMGSGNNPCYKSSSPRLQHRVPIFVEGYDKPLKSSVDSTSSNCDANKKPNVRVIPIEIEGEARPSTRHRTFSGPARYDKEQFVHEREDNSPLKRSMHDSSKLTKMKAAAEPVVYNIPIKIEGRNSPVKSPRLEKVTKSSLSKKDGQKCNGCAASKSPNKIKSENGPKSESTAEQKVESGISVALKKIENVLEELRTYESGVQEFNHTVKDKQYRYLDEMLTRCMLRLDDIDTMGNDEVRSARKGAVKKVQASVDLLETKVTKEPEVVGKVTESELKNVEMQCNDQLPKDVMKESDTEDGKEKNDKVIHKQISEVEMAENNEVQIGNGPVGTAEVPSESPEVQMTDVESASQDNSEVTDLNEQKITLESKPSAPSEVTEVEMVEAKNVTPNDCSTNEIQEVEMTGNEPDEPEVSHPFHELLNVTSEVDMATVTDSKTLRSSDSLCLEDKSCVDMQDVKNKPDQKHSSEFSQSAQSASNQSENEQYSVDVNVSEVTSDNLSKTVLDTKSNDTSQNESTTEL